MRSHELARQMLALPDGEVITAERVEQDEVGFVVKSVNLMMLNDMSPEMQRGIVLEINLDVQREIHPMWQIDPEDGYKQFPVGTRVQVTGTLFDEHDCRVEFNHCHGRVVGMADPSMILNLDNGQKVVVQFDERISSVFSGMSVFVPLSLITRLPPKWG